MPKAFVLFSVPILAAYFLLVFYLVSAGPDRLATSGGFRWFLCACFFLSTALLGFGANRLMKRKTTGLTNAGSTRRANFRPAKRLLVGYLILLPVALVALFTQTAISPWYALLALIPPVLSIIVLWRSVFLRRGKTESVKISENGPAGGVQ